MAHPILMPRPGQMTEECTLVAWHKEEGEPVTKGEVLFEIETDKSVMEVEAFDEGVLLRRLVEVGQTVPVNSVVAYVGQPGESIPLAEPPVASGEAAAERPAEPPSPGAAVAPAVAAGPAADPAERGRPVPPRVGISPRASRLAAEAGVDTREISGSGPDGRIVERDVRAAIAGRRAAAKPEPPASVGPTPVGRAAMSAEGEAPPRPLSRMRRVIAERMTLSATTIPQFEVTVAIDVTRLVELRSRLKAEGSALTLTDFVLAAAARSLVAMPVVNSWTDGEQVWLRRRVHLGLAVALPNGLVVVVLRDADQMTIEEIHQHAAEMAAAARAGKLSPDLMSGSTFSVSNLGMHGVERFTAIINPGESAVLAVSSAIPTPVAVGAGIGIRPLMRLSLSADHRLIDGETAAQFLGDLRRRLEDPQALLARQFEV